MKGEISLQFSWTTQRTLCRGFLNNTKTNVWKWLCLPQPVRTWGPEQRYDPKACRMVCYFWNQKVLTGKHSTESSMDCTVIFWKWYEIISFFFVGWSWVDFSFFFPLNLPRNIVRKSECLASLTIALEISNNRRREVRQQIRISGFKKKILGVQLKESIMVLLKLEG